MKTVNESIIASHLAANPRYYAAHMADGRALRDLYEGTIGLAYLRRDNPFAYDLISADLLAIDWTALAAEVDSLALATARD